MEIFIYLMLEIGDNKYCYKYDILTDTYEQKQKMPDTRYRAGIASVGTDIYLFGGYSGWYDVKSCYKYDILTDTFTTKSQMPNDSDNVFAITVGSDIYVFHGTHCYKYDTITDTYKELTDIPSTIYTASIVDDKIYVFCSNKTVNSMNLTLDTYPNNSLIISQGHGGYPTQLFSYLDVSNRLLWEFYDVWHYTTENGFNKTIPTYYGDGEKWVKFKN